MCSPLNSTLALRMRSDQIKRKRPTMQSAHDYYKEGSFYSGPEHRLGGAERKAEIEAVVEDLRNLVKTQFPRTGILEYAVLKAHLIVEHALTQYIRCFAATAVAVEDVRFTFAQKMDIAYLMGFGANQPTLLPIVERLNKVRNQVAHRFDMDRRQLDEMLRISSGDYEDFSVTSDKDRIRKLRYTCYGVCGFTAGLIVGGYVVATEQLGEARLGK